MAIPLVLLLFQQFRGDDKARSVFPFLLFAVYTDILPAFEHDHRKYAVSLLFELFRIGFIQQNQLYDIPELSDPHAIRLQKLQDMMAVSVVYAHFPPCGSIRFKFSSGTFGHKIKLLVNYQQAIHHIFQNLTGRV